MTSEALELGEPSLCSKYNDITINIVHVLLLLHYYYLYIALLLFCTQGHLVRVLGDIGDKDTENEVLLLEHDIPHAHFSEDVLACLPQLPWTISEEVGVLVLYN